LVYRAKIHRSPRGVMGSEHGELSKTAPGNFVPKRIELRERGHLRVSLPSPHCIKCILGH